MLTLSALTKAFSEAVQNSTLDLQNWTFPSVLRSSKEKGLLGRPKQVYQLKGHALGKAAVQAQYQY